MSVQSATLDVATDRAASRTDAVPWFLYSVLFASTSVLVGVIWDISWHRSIGRDSFWTPAHVAIYLGGVVAGLTCGWLAIRITFGVTQARLKAATTVATATPTRAESVRFWGFYAPFGAWVCIWGTLAMLTSAPFDDWWHNTYGLDVKILSPPHVVLAAGIGAIQIGAMLMILAWQNRSAHRRFAQLFLLASGLLLLNATVLSTEHIQRWDMHQSLFWQVSAAVFPFYLVSCARASAARWPATATALVYTGLTLVMLIVLPLFSARPMLGPIHVQLDRFMPPDFPLLLVAPAVAIDIVMRRFGRRADWRLAALVSTVFLGVFLAVQWPFADFLMSSWARNALFVSHRMDYGVPPAIQARWFQINPPDNLALGLPIAVALGFVSARVGLWWGNWMSRVQR